LCDCDILTSTESKMIGWPMLISMRLEFKKFYLYRKGGRSLPSSPLDSLLADISVTTLAYGP